MILKDTLKHWQEQADIDWFSQYIKAWIPFNAWYRHRYGPDQNERDVLELIKSDANDVHRGIIPLFTNAGQEAEKFRNHVASLHSCLENCSIENRKRRLTFTCVDIGPNPSTQFKESYYKTTYTVERNVPTKNYMTIKLASPSGVYLHIEQPVYNLLELQAHPDFIKLGDTVKTFLLKMYKQTSPRIESNLLENSGEYLQIGAYRFSNRPELIFAALVEVLYGMRNILFHGEITPTNTHNKIYEPAYYILRTFVDRTI